MEDFEVVCWPESQDLMELKGFRKNCRLINGERGLKEFGSSAYLVPSEWLKTAKEDYFGEDDDELETVSDQELEDLYLM